MINNEQGELKTLSVLDKKTTTENQKISKPQIRKAEQPLGNAKGSERSVSVFLEETERKKQEKINALNQEKNLPENHFSEEKLKEEWQRFLNVLERENPIVYTIINPFVLSKKGENEIEVAYSSDTAKSKFEEIQAEFFNQFKQKVNNFKISVSYKKNESLKSEMITTRKKFEKMVEVNPVLKDLEKLMMFEFN